MNPPEARERRAWLATAAAGALAAASTPAPADPPPGELVLSTAQRRWLAAHSPIRWLPERDYAPFVSVGEDGRIRGLSVDILNLIATLTGIEFQPLQARPLNEQLALAARRFGDLVTSVRATPERAAYLLFTRPYVSVPTLLVARDPAGAGPGLSAMARQAVAVGSGFAVESSVRAAYPEVDWRGVPSDLDGLEGVAAGRFAAAVVDAASAGSLLARPHLAHLRAVADVGFRYELCFAVRKDWPELLEILDMAIERIPRARLQALRDQWLAVPGADVAPPRAPLATWAGVALLAAGGAGAAALALRRRRDLPAVGGGS